MLTPLQPPTDNLYKFMAISGLVLFVVINVSLEWAIHDLEVRSVDLDAQIRILEIEGADLSSQANIIEKQLDLPRGAPQLESLRARLADLKAVTVQSQIKTVRVDSANKTLRLLTRDARRYWWYSWLGLPLASVLTVCGFALWYVRLQRYQDAAARNLASKG